MTNTERIQANNAELRECIEIAENLPDVGGGAEPVIEALSVTANGAYTAPDGVDGYSPVTVNVPVPDGYIKPSGTLEVTENGTHDVTEYASVNVNVEASGGAESVIEDMLIGGFSKESLTEYTNERVTVIRDYIFNGFSSLKTVNLPNVETISGYAFQNCTALTEANIPLAKSAASGAFRYTKLSNIYFPLMTSIGTNTFGNITAPNTIHLPKLITVANSSIRDNTGVTRTEFDVASKIDNLALYMCSKLIAVILRKSDSICTLANVNAFTGTGISKGTGYIYVPFALADTYKTATNWSTYAAQFRALEDYTVDGTITGELDEAKIAA